MAEYDPPPASERTPAHPAPRQASAFPDRTGGPTPPLRLRESDGSGTALRQRPSEHRWQLQATAHNRTESPRTRCAPCTSCGTNSAGQQARSARASAPPGWYGVPAEHCTARRIPYRSPPTHLAQPCCSTAPPGRRPSPHRAGNIRTGSDQPSIYADASAVDRVGSDRKCGVAPPPRPSCCYPGAQSYHHHDRLPVPDSTDAKQVLLTAPTRAANLPVA